MSDAGALPRCMPDGWRRIVARTVIGGRTFEFSAWATRRADLRLEPMLVVSRPFWRRLLGLPSKATVHVHPRVVARDSDVRFTLPLLVKGRFDG